MARRPSLGPRRLLIRRDFDPSRFQRRDLAFAFEQAAPIIRKSIDSNIGNAVIIPADPRPAARAARFGARS